MAFFSSYHLALVLWDKAYGFAHYPRWLSQDAHECQNALSFWFGAYIHGSVRELRASPWKAILGTITRTTSSSPTCEERFAVTNEFSKHPCRIRLRAHNNRLLLHAPSGDLDGILRVSKVKHCVTATGDTVKQYRIQPPAHSVPSHGLFYWL